MLEAIKGKKAIVNSVEKKGTALYLNTDFGKIMLEVISDTIIHVVYTLEDEFSQKKGLGLANEKFIETCPWSYEDSIETIRLKTDKLTLHINKKNSAFSFTDQNGQMILREPNQGGKQLIAYDAFKTIFDDQSEVERIETPDGIKEIVRASQKEYSGVLYHSRMSFEWTGNEAIYGFGQQEEGTLNLRGTRQYIHQANMKIAMPFFMSTKGYGILIDTYSPLIFNDNAYGSYIYNEACEALDYYFIKGTNFDEVISGYRKLTGSATMLPKWAFGFMQSMERYESQEEIIDTVKKFRKSGIPLDSIVLDWQSWEEGMWGQKTFDESRFPDAKEMTKTLHDLGAHFMISLWPNMRRECDNYKEMERNNALLPKSEIYNAFDQQSRDLYWKQTNQGLFSKGVDAWWCDSCEPFTPEWNQKIKPEPDQNYLDFHQTARTYMDECYTNAYPLVHAQTMYEGQRKVTDTKRVTNLTRSGYTGQQKYGTILWSGDISASWKTIKDQIPAGLNLCASGLPYWTFDIGAFFVKQGELWFWNGQYEEGCEDLGYRELYTRFYQMGTFLPVFRSHGTDTRREIWNYGEKGSMFYDSIAKFTHLRYELLHYIYSLAGKVTQNNYTIMRLLAFDFMQDVNTYDIQDQYMFGDSIMVCPVTVPMYYGPSSEVISGVEKQRKVYLPLGVDWYNYWTNELYQGNQEITALAPIDILPLYIKAGTILPLANPMQYTGECDEAHIRLRIYPGTDGSFELYQDEGDNYNYEMGSFSVIKLYWTESNKTLKITNREGSYFNMPECIEFQIEGVGLSTTTILYDGTEVVISL